MKVNIINGQKACPIAAARIIRTVKSTSSLLKLKCAQINIVFVGRARMRRINRQFLGHDFVTDVITFDYAGRSIKAPQLDLDVAAEIVICPDVAKVQSLKMKMTYQKELILYVVHGLLHLAGYDDHGIKETARMRQMEQRLLSSVK